MKFCWLGMWNIPTASLQRGKTQQTSVLNTTLNNLMARLLYWSFGEYGVLPSLPLFLGPLSPGVVAPDWVLSMGQIELFDTSTCTKLNC